MPNFILSIFLTKKSKQQHRDYSQFEYYSQISQQYLQQQSQEQLYNYCFPYQYSNWTYYSNLNKYQQYTHATNHIQTQMKLINEKKKSCPEKKKTVSMSDDQFVVTSLIPNDNQNPSIFDSILTNQASKIESQNKGNPEEKHNSVVLTQSTNDKSEKQKEKLDIVNGKKISNSKFHNLDFQPQHDIVYLPNHQNSNSTYQNHSYNYNYDQKAYNNWMIWPSSSQYQQYMQLTNTKATRPNIIKYIDYYEDQNKIENPTFRRKKEKKSSNSLLTNKKKQRNLSTGSSYGLKSINEKKKSSPEEYKPIYSPEINDNLVMASLLPDDDQNQNRSTLDASSTNVTSTSKSQNIGNSVQTHQSTKEEEILNSIDPIPPTNNESEKQIEELGISGIIMNSDEIKNWQGDLTKHKLRDGPTKLITKEISKPIEYEQNISVQYLKAPTPPPLNIILKKEPHKIIKAPPLIVRLPECDQRQPETIISNI